MTVCWIVKNSVYCLYTRKLWYKHFTPAFWLHNMYNLLNTQNENTNSKGDVDLNNLFETFVLKISGIQNKSDSDLVWRIQSISI